MSAIRLTGSTSGYAEITPSAVAGDQTFTLPGTGGTLDRLERAGNILQVVNATYSTGASTTSTSFTDTGLSASITPSSTSNKILVLVSQNGIFKGAVNNYIRLKLLRSSTDLVEFEAIAGFTGVGDTQSVSVGGASACYLDSPSTTSSVTYKTQFASGNSGVSITIQLGPGGGVTTSSTITLMEVAA